MDSGDDTAEAVGCPIRRFTDQNLLAVPRDLSQRATSFIASQCQGIHQMPFLRLILEAYSAARRNKPARDLSRHKMLHNTSHSPSLAATGRRASSVTHLFALHLSKTPTHRNASNLPADRLSPEREVTCP